MSTAPPIEVQGLVNRFGRQTVHDGLALTVQPGEILGIVGGSGTGKSVLLRTLVGLNRPAAGDVTVLGEPIWRNGQPVRSTRRRDSWGMLFQDGALFSALTVARNVQVPLTAHTKMPRRLRDDIAALKIALAGLPPDAGDKYPSQLSGGMRKRAGLARALALDPEILFLDEPTAGLDPIGAAAFDQLVMDLRDTLGLTVVMVTHDLDSLVRACDRIAVLADQQVLIAAPLSEVSAHPHGWIQAYFHGPRARAAGVPSTTDGLW